MADGATSNQYRSLQLGKAGLAKEMDFCAVKVLELAWSQYDRTKFQCYQTSLSLERHKEQEAEIYVDQLVSYNVCNIGIEKDWIVKLRLPGGDLGRYSHAPYRSVIRA